MKKFVFSTLFLVALLATSYTASADAKSNADELVNKSLATVENFASDPEMSWFRNHIQDAKGILIVPTEVQAAFLVGASGGSGVLLRHNNVNEWSYPSFVGMGSISAGFQIGGQAAEVVLLIMTEKGMDKLMSTKAQLGLDASIAAGPVGAGAAVATADILQFARAKGVFGGLSVDGAIISPRNKLNEAYYGQEVILSNILVQGTVSNAQADPLRNKLASFRDSDGDGVSDDMDKCPGTPKGAKVDKEGCWAFHGVVFEFDSAEIKADSEPLFDNAVVVLQANPEMTVQINGYTDSKGNTDYNLKLSESRAQAVKDYLVVKGIDPSRLTVKGYGAADPVASNDTEEGRAYNRRVAFTKTDK